MSNLKRGGIPLASTCPLCGEAEEDIHHLLIHCPKIWELWVGGGGGLLFSVDAAWVCPPLVRDLFWARI